MPKAALQSPTGVSPSLLLNSLAGLLHEWLPRQRWFAGKGRPVTGLTLASMTELHPGCLHLLVRAEHAEQVTRTGSGTPPADNLYQLLLGVREMLPPSLAPAFIGRATEGPLTGLMVYDAFAHVPIYGLEDLGFVGRGEAGAFIAEGHTSPGGRLPLNTNGGGLSYTHTGMYGMFAIQEAVRQLRGEAAAQVPGVEVSVVLGNGGMFATAATLILSNRLP